MRCGTNSTSSRTLPDFEATDLDCVIVLELHVTSGTTGHSNGTAHTLAHGLQEVCTTHTIARAEIMVSALCLVKTPGGS